MRPRPFPFTSHTDYWQYYKPWELTPQQEDLIKQQVQEAQTTINRELADFELRSTTEQKEDTNMQDQPVVQEAQQDAEAQRGAEADKVSPELTQEATESALGENTDDIADQASMEPDDAGSVPVQTPGDDSSATAANESVTEEMKDAVDDEQGETFVEADEDTVIY